MGSLWGHIFEGGLFFVGLAIWCFFRMFRDYIQAIEDGSVFKSRVSFPTMFRGRQVPLELFVKIFFIIVGFMVELGVAHGFIDENGEFKRVTALQHMSIYTLFMLHVLVDLGQFYGVLNIRGLDYFTAALAYFWNGTVFIFHSFVKDRLEIMIHYLGIVLCYGFVAGILWEYCSQDKFTPNYFRNLMTLTLGTWFTHTAFYLFSTAEFPGVDPNPNWDRNSMKNLEFAATMLGFHLFVNVLVTIGIYFLVKLCCRKSQAVSVKTSNGGFQLLSTQADDEEKGGLLCSDDEETSSLT